jgi:hypothetical protein
LTRNPRVARLEAKGLRRLFYRVDYEVKTLVASHPRLALPVARLRGHGVVLSPRSALLIEGFSRSANSFAVKAFEMANGLRSSVAHHTHASAHVMTAVHAGVPALVLIREPEESVLETVIARPTCSVRQALRGWIRFYRALLPYRRGFVVGLFSEVTSDFGAVIRRVNGKFGTAFYPFHHNEANVQACFEAMDAYWRARVGSGPTLERFVGRPSTLRDEMKEALRPGYADDRLARMSAQADSYYREFADFATP